MGKRKKNIFDNMFDRADDISRDVRRAGRRSFGSRRKSKKKASTRKLAKRNHAELRALTEQVSLLVHHLASRPTDGLRDPGRVTAPSAGTRHPSTVDIHPPVP